MTDVLTTVYGFVPAKTLDGSGNVSTIRFKKNASATGDDARIAVGDPVRLTGNGTVEKWLTADVSAAAGTFLGVVAGIVNANGAPKAHTATQSSSVSVSGETTDQFDVIVGNDVVYRVCTQLSAQSATTAQALVGSTVNVAYLSATGVDVRLGRSTAYVAPATGTEGAAAPFRVVGVSTTVSDTTNQVFEVVPNYGVFKNNTAAI